MKNLSSPKAKKERLRREKIRTKTYLKELKVETRKRAVLEVRGERR